MSLYNDRSLLKHFAENKAVLQQVILTTVSVNNSGDQYMQYRYCLVFLKKTDEVLFQWMCKINQGRPFQRNRPSSHLPLLKFMVCRYRSEHQLGDHFIFGLGNRKTHFSVYLESIIITLVTFSRRYQVYTVLDNKRSHIY